MSQTKSDESWVTIEEYLLFVLTQITGHSATRVASYFMDLGIQLSVNTAEKCWDEKHRCYIKTTVTCAVGTMTVRTMRGYYPNTPISFTLSSTLAADQLILRVTATEQTDTLHFDFDDLRENLSREVLLDDPTPAPKLKRPKSITPPGMTPQRYSPKRS
jgi:hypothetical protein